MRRTEKVSLQPVEGALELRADHYAGSCGVGNDFLRERQSPVPIVTFDGIPLRWSEALNGVFDIPFLLQKEPVPIGKHKFEITKLRLVHGRVVHLSEDA